MRQWAMALVAVSAWNLARCKEDQKSGAMGPPAPEQVLAGLGRDGVIPIKLITDHGDVACELHPGGAKQAVALFVGLATGRARWRHPKTGEVHEDAMYRELTFHRAIPGVMAQTGCVVGDGSGYPGFRIPVESRPDDADRLRRPGALVLARYTPPPFRQDPNPPPPGHVLGSQFAVTLTDMSHLAGKVAVIGRCGDLDVVAAVARAVAKGGARPRLKRVSVDGGKAFEGEVRHLEAPQGETAHR